MNDISTALAPYEPKDLSEAQILAVSFAKSGFLTGITTPDQALLIMATGHELGIPATAALRSIHVISGKPVLSADLMVALVKRSGVCEYFRVVESTDERAVYATKRRGDPEVKQAFTVQDAKRAGIGGGGNWAKYPRVMLRHRAAAELARLVYPDVILGVYAEEELADLPPAEVVSVQDDVIDAEIPPPPPSPEDEWLSAIAGCGTVDELHELRTAIREAHGAKVPRLIANAWRDREAALRVAA